MEIKKFLVFGLVAMVIGVARGDDTADQASATTKKYVTDELSELQNTIPAQSGARAITYTTTPGTIAPREVKTNLGTSTTDTAMPTVSAVNTELATKQNEIPAADANTVVTYTDTAGTVSEKGIYQDTGTYAEQSESLIDAGTFNAALQNALNMEFVCAGYVDDDPTKPCWLWQISTGNPNLFNKDDPSVVFDGFIQRDSHYLVSWDAGDKTLIIPVEPLTTYTIQRKTDIDARYDRMRVAAFATYPVHGMYGTVVLNIVGATTPTGTFITLENTKYVAINVRNSDYDHYGLPPIGDDWTEFLNTFKMEEGSVATSYKPYIVYIPQNQSAQSGN